MTPPKRRYVVFRAQTPDRYWWGYVVGLINGAALAVAIVALVQVLLP